MPRKAGNHGRIIPRDEALLRDLYWTQRKTSLEIAAMFNVTHKSVLRVFRQLGIPRRGVGKSRHDRCIECGKPVFKVRHAGNGALYGKRCKQHWNEHRAKLAKQEGQTTKGQARKRRLHARWYYEGPVNPKGESQWLNKGRAMLRRAKRTIRAASQSQKEESEPERSSLA